MAEIKMIHPIGGGVPIIANVTRNHREDHYTLENPMSLSYYMDEDGNERVRVGNMLLYAKGNTLNIRTDHVLFIYDPSDETVEFYNKKVTNAD